MLLSVELVGTENCPIVALSLLVSLLHSPLTLIHESYTFILVTGGVPVHRSVRSDRGWHGGVVHPALGRPETQSQDQLTFLNPGPSLPWNLCFENPQVLN